MATELAKAYVQIIPSAKGIGGSISEALGGEADSAGKSSGKSLAASLGGTLKKTLVGLGIGKMISDAIGDASEFETSMAKVSTLYTGDNFSGLQTDILNLSSAYGLGATTLAEAAYSAESAGVSMENLTGMLEGSAKLAVAGFTDIDTALSATAKTMNAYGDAAGSIEDIQKVLIQTQNLGITTVGELGASLANVTPTAAAAGVGFDQVGAALAQMTANGVPTAQATTQLRAAMTELSKTGTAADKSFRKAAAGTKYANMSFQQAISSGANLGDVFGLMQSYADKSGKSMVDLWGSVEAGNAAMTIAADVEKFNENLEAMSTEADVVGDAYGKMADTFGTSMNKLKESAKNFMTTLFQGGDITASFDQMLQNAGDIGGKLLGWIENAIRGIGQNLPQMMGSLIDFGAGLIDSLAQVDWIGLGTTIINGIIGALGTLGTKLIELVGGAITGVANGEIDFGSIGKAIWNGVTSVITTAGDWLSKLFKTAVGAVGGEGGVDFGSIGKAILGGVTSFLDGAGQFLIDIFSPAKDAVADDTNISWGDIGNSILNGVTGAIDTAGKFLEGAFKAGKALVEKVNWSNLGTTIGNGVNGVIDVGGKFLEGCFTAGKKLVETIKWDDLGEKIGQGVNSTIDVAGKFLEGCFTAAKSLIEKIKWDDIGTTIANGVNGVVDTGGKFLEGCFTAAKSLVEAIKWDDLGTKIGGGVNTVIDAAGAFLEAPFKAAKGLVSAIDWTDLGTKIGNGVSGTIDAAGSFLKAPFEAGKKLIEAIPWAEVGKAISGGLGDVWSGLTGFVGGLLGGAGDAAAGLGKGVGDIAEGFGSAVKKLLSGDELKTQVEELKKNLEELKTAVEGAKKDAETAAKNISKAIADGLKNDLGTVDMQGIGSGCVMGITTGLQDADEIASMSGAVDDLVSKVYTPFDSYDFNGTGSNVINRISAGAMSQIGVLNIIMLLIAAAGARQFETYDWKGVGSTLISGIGSGVNTNAITFTNAMQGAMDNGAAKVTGVDWGRHGENIIVNMGMAVSKNAGQFTEPMKTAAETGKSFFTSGWNSVGSDIISGIISGISARSGALYNHMRTVARNALAAAKNALGIASPSKVMQDQVGQWIPAGIAAGIEQSSGMVTDAMTEMAGNMASVNMADTLMAQGRRVGRMNAGSQAGGGLAGVNGILQNIAAAVQEGIQNATIPVYMDGRLVSNEVSRNLGNAIGARRFAT